MGINDLQNLTVRRALWLIISAWLPDWMKRQGRARGGEVVRWNGDGVTAWVSNWRQS